MCGLVGAAGNLTFKEEKMVRTLLILDSLRGEDSTGICAIPAVGDALVAKGVGGPFDLFYSKKYETAMKQSNRAIIGHNRFATMGGVSKRTAHPFEFDSLVGVHNGTLKNKHNLLDAKDFAVDSQNLYHHIDQKGLKSALQVLDGAWALVWWEKDTDSLKILRNKERPLFVAYSKDNKCLFWASEQWMLQVASSRCDVEIGNIFPIVEDMLYTHHIGADKVLSKPKLVHSPSTYVAPVYNGYMNNQNWKGGVNTVKTETATEPKKSVGKTIAPTGALAYYTGRKDIKLEVMGEGTDACGAIYVQLMDPQWPAAPLRVYPQRQDSREFTIGSEIFGNFSEFVSRPEGDYFKISPHGIFFIDSADIDLTSFADVLLYDDGKGHKLTEKEWESKFSNCDWCFDPLFASDHGNRMNGTGGCFCAKCANNAEATQGLRLTAVY